MYTRPKGQLEVRGKFDELVKARTNKKIRSESRLFGDFHPILRINPKDKCEDCGGDKPPYRYIHVPPSQSVVVEEEEKMEPGSSNIRPNYILPSSINFWTDQRKADGGHALVCSGDGGPAIVPESPAPIQKRGRGRQDRGESRAHQRRRRQAAAVARKQAGVSKKV